jgi:hypothetical protein
MGTAPRRAGRYSPSDGFLVPSEGFTGKPDVECPQVGDDARSWWATWATSGYAHFFTSVEWQDLADTARLMDAYYRGGHSRDIAEARQHVANLFGLATRARLHITFESSPAEPAQAGEKKRREDPRLKAI